MKETIKNDYDNVRSTFEQICTLLGKSIDTNKIKIIESNAPHKYQKLPENSMGIYMFKYKDEFLKIGKVNSKSNARFTSQHYSSTSTRSNLAKSILENTEFCERHSITKDNIKEWMLQNLDRIEILLEDSLGVFVLNLLEACLHYKYSPKYEGYRNQKH